MGCFNRGGCKRAARQPDCGVVRIPLNRSISSPAGSSLPLPKRPAGGPLRAIALVQLVKVVIFRGKKSVGITRNGSTKLLYHDDR